MEFFTQATPGVETLPLVASPSCAPRIDAHDQSLAQLHKRADGAHERIDDILTR
jgi:hypothetical protein